MVIKDSFVSLNFYFMPLLFRNMSYDGNLAGLLSRVLIDIESHSGVYGFHVFGSTKRL